MKKFALVEELRTGTCRFTGKPYDCAHCEGAERVRPDHDHPVTIHCHMSISGPIERDSKREWGRMAINMKCSDGSVLLDEELRDFFLELHSLGADAFPMCECDKFCYKNGCRGHKREVNKQ